MHPAPAVRRLGTLLLLASTTAAAQSPDAILKRVDDRYNHLASLRTRYLERYQGMGLDRSEAGTLLLKKPGRMLWRYDTPSGKVFVLDGKYAWFYTPGDPQAQRLAASKLDDLRSPLRFLLGHTRLAKELERIEVTPAADGFHIAGIPQGMGARLRELALDVTPTGQITHMRLTEADGATTDFTFTDAHDNPPVADSDFVFHPPAGVAIVDALPPV